MSEKDKKVLLIGIITATILILAGITLGLHLVKNKEEVKAKKGYSIKYLIKEKI